MKDIKYRKMLIRLFVNRIYLYDDHLTTTFNTGEDTVEINDRLLAELEENSDKERLLFKGKDGPPNQYNPNLYPIGDGFGFIVYIEEIVDW